MTLAFSVRPQAQETNNEEEDAPKVTESELQVYIEVYTAMQADHGLALADALKPHDLSVEQFRNLERRIQREQRYVDRVRKALLDYAKGRVVDSNTPPGNTPAPTAGQP